MPLRSCPVMARSPAFIAGFDSASAMLRALGCCLHGKRFTLFENPYALAPFGAVLNCLPQSVRQFIYGWLGPREAVAPERLAALRTEAVSRWMLAQYPRRRYPAVMVGASNGALTHLCALLGIPWLPQTWLIPVHHPGLDPDEPIAAMDWGLRYGPPCSPLIRRCSSITCTMPTRTG